MSALCLLVLAAFSQLAADPPSTRPGADPSYRASIRAMNDRQVFAQTEGLLTTVNVKQGSQVKKDGILALVDDLRAQAAVDVAQVSYVAADERAKDTIEEQYATRAHEVAVLDYKQSEEANRNSKGNVISLIEMEKKRLDADRADLQIEKARKDRRLARLDADVKNAELKAAKDELERRTIRAAFDGEVQELLVKESEWVNPGDPILRLVQFDVMWVECLVDASKYDPAELQGRPVTVRVNLARDRQASLAGRVVYVSQDYLESSDAETYGSSYLVRAEVQNRREGNFWLVRPGMPAWLTIHVNQPPVDAEQAAAQGARVSAE
jgi:multidrug efflux pump subunit AcrA (membrane-fusion protein)